LGREAKLTRSDHRSGDSRFRRECRPSHADAADTPEQLVDLVDVVDVFLINA
jgi:hypothetical protein